ncbi:MAG: hypothetical protein OEY14_00725 [Myxococcales bacterium]|nr:hypothetical protein [Myxococcales bacterium]
MPESILLAAAIPLRSEGATPPRAKHADSGARFAATLRAPEAEPTSPEPPSGPSPARALIEDAASSIGRGQAQIERALRRARRGQGMAPEELLALQAGVYRYSQELELASKVVDKVTGAIRQTLQSQQ